MIYEETQIRHDFYLRWIEFFFIIHGMYLLLFFFIYAKTRTVHKPIPIDDPRLDNSSYSFSANVKFSSDHLHNKNSVLAVVFGMNGFSGDAHSQHYTRKCPGWINNFPSGKCSIIWKTTGAENFSWWLPFKRSSIDYLKMRLICVWDK